jgi:hypothetical protein
VSGPRVPRLSAEQEVSAVDLVGGVLLDVVRASWSFERLQLDAWPEYAKLVPSVEGVSLAEGLARLASLHVRDVDVTLWLEEVRPGVLRRVRGWYRRVRGREPLPRRFRIATARSSPGAIRIRIGVRRAAGGSYEVTPDGATIAGMLETPALAAGAARG